MKEHDFAKYLRKHPAPPLPPEMAGCRRFAVIPACDENEEMGNTLRSLAACGGIEGVRVIVVINHPPEAPEQVRRENERLRDRFAAGEFAVPATVFYRPDLEGGVGAARKLGLDAAAASQNACSIEETILYSLDADSPVEPGYFAAVDRCFAAHPGAGALSIGYRHRPGDTPAGEAAIRRYEAYLKRYVEKLRAAGSPYAFHTVGSAFACRGGAYLRAGGMRVRRGGEDFYFLQAVAKSSKVVELPEVLVHPSPRPSARVPFGTGPAVAGLLRGEGLREVPDAAFAELAQVLAAAREPITDPEAFSCGASARRRRILPGRALPRGVAAVAFEPDPHLRTLPRLVRRPPDAPLSSFSGTGLIQKGIPPTGCPGGRFPACGACSEGSGESG